MTTLDALHMDLLMRIAALAGRSIVSLAQAHRAFTHVRTAVLRDVECLACLLKSAGLIHGTSDDEVMRNIRERGMGMPAILRDPVASMTLARTPGVDIHAGNDLALRFAAEHGRTELAAVLLERGADVHAGDDHALRLAASSNHVDMLRLLIEHGADATAKNSRAIVRAASRGGVEALSILLDNGASLKACATDAIRACVKGGHVPAMRFLLHRVEGTSTERRTIACVIDDVLEHAAARGCIEEVERMLLCGASKATVDVALCAAARGGHHHVVRLLLNRGASVNVDEGRPLRSAAAAGFAQVVKVLLEHGADVSAAPGREPAQVWGRNDALKAATAPLGVQDLDTIKLLVTHGARAPALEHCIGPRTSIDVVKVLIKVLIKARMPSGVGPAPDTENQREVDDALTTAAYAGRIDIIETLFDAGASVAGSSRALAVAAAHGHVELVERLLSRGADMGNALVWACQNGHPRVAEMILAKQHVPHDELGRALGGAAAFGRAETARLLLERGADVHASQDYALCVSVNLDYADVVEVLLRYGADANATCDWKGRDPACRDEAGRVSVLRRAVQNGNSSIAKALLRHGADARAHESDALRCAVRWSHYDMAKLLLEHGAQPRGDMADDAFKPSKRMRRLLRL